MKSIIYQRYNPYAIAVAATAIALLITKLIEPLLIPTPSALFFAAVAIAAWYGGMKPGLVATVLSALALNYFFAQHLYKSGIANASDVVRLGAFLIVTIIINLLNSDLHRSRQQIEKLSQQLLQESADQLHLALSAARMGMWNWNILTGELNWSPEHEQLFGLAPGTFDGRIETFDAHLHPSDREGLTLAMNRAIQEKNSFQYEYRIVWSDNSVHWMESRGHAFYDETDRAVRMTGTVMDISDRKFAEATIRGVNEELESRVAERTAELSYINDRLHYELNERHRTEKRLREQAQILDQAHDTILTRDFNGIITFWNHGAERMYGWSKSEAVGKESHSLLQTQFTPPLAEIKAKLFSQGYWEGELIHARRDGISIVVASRWVLRRDEGGRPIEVLEINNDITERKRVKQALIESEKRFRAIFEQTFQFMGLMKPDGTLLEANQTALNFGGLHRSDVVNRPFWEALWWRISSDTQNRLKTAIAEAATGQFVRYEVDVLGAGDTVATIDFSIKPIKDETGNVVLLIPEGRDISDRKRVEATLQESDRRWRSLLDNVQLVVVGLDRTGQVEYVNSFFLNLTGYTSAEVLGKNWFDYFIPPSNRPELDTVFHEVLEHNFHSYYQNSILLKSGEERFIAWNNTLLRDVRGKIIGTISIGEDITQRQAVERMKNEFISIVSHELRTPLTAIRGSLGLLVTGIYDNKPEKAKRMIEIALTDSDRLVRLVNDILDLERLDSGKVTLLMEVCDAADLMRRTVEAMQAIAHNNAITLSVSPGTARVWAAPDTIIQTLTNLLSNAIKFSPPNSTITLTAQPQSDCVLFQVKDQGRGIPADKLETIFGRFQQVDVSDSRLKGGTGLGLAICKSIIEQHKGQIGAESTLGEGSTFYFTLAVPPEQESEPPL